MAKRTRTLEDMKPGSVGVKTEIPSLRGTSYAGSKLIDRVQAEGEVFLTHASLVKLGRQLLESTPGPTVKATDEEVLAMVTGRLLPSVYQAAKARGVKASITNKAKRGRFTAMRIALAA